MKKTFKHIITIFSFLLIFITNISIANATVLSNFNNDYYLETVITDANPTFSFSTLQSKILRFFFQLFFNCNKRKFFCQIFIHFHHI